jgi:hypothetical protein
LYYGGITYSREDGAQDCGLIDGDTGNDYCISDDSPTPNINVNLGNYDMDTGDDSIQNFDATIGQPGAIELTLTNDDVADLTLYVNVWIDFNQDGDWADVVDTEPEHVTINAPLAVGGGSSVDQVYPMGVAGIPASAMPGFTWVRVLITNAALDTTPCDASSTGCHTAGVTNENFHGEVEDHELELQEDAAPEFSSIALLLAVLGGLAGIFAVRRKK